MLCINIRLIKISLGTSWNISPYVNMLTQYNKWLKENTNRKSKANLILNTKQEEVFIWITILKSWNKFLNHHITTLKTLSIKKRIVKKENSIKSTKVLSNTLTSKELKWNKKIEKSLLQVIIIWTKQINKLNND